MRGRERQKLEEPDEDELKRKARTCRILAGM